MGITVFSFMMSVIWFNIFIAMISFIRLRSSFILNFSLAPLLFLVATCFFRLLCSFELPITFVIHSVWIFPTIIDFLTISRFSIWNNGIDLSLLNLLMILWALGSIYFLQVYMRQSIQLMKIIRTGEETQDKQLLSCLKQIQETAQQNTKVKFIRASWITVPMVTGFFKPTIFLPDISFTDAELQSILLHEWNHFLNKDTWIKLYMCLISIIFWWNPFIYILKVNLNHILEIRCDLKLTNQMSDDNRLEYLKSITKIIKFQLSLKENSEYDKLPTMSFLVSTNNMKKIEQRFMLVLDNQPTKKRKVSSILVYVTIFLLFLVSYMFVLQPAYEPTVEAGYEQSFSISAENAYIKNNSDGTYSLYVNNQYQFNITDISEEPFLSLPIKQ
ncbi:M56 family metallopeptidase [Aminipila butyrica]|uniref:M56 family metallopeptidase n=1 Tax=Aminipila butyrica TaxID=433296 RepID=A0A858BXK5_9FIRM|nr:M56 family metallopeptidase [Aminipila butyrica]QIB70307.1 M56 family metallopeptidase [Aminipila butyrica]